MAKTRRERIYLIPRWPGLVLAVTTFTLLSLFALGFAISSDRPLPPALGIALLVAGLVALIQSNENLRGVEVHAGQTAPTAAGEVAQIEFAVRNGGGHERVGLEVRQGQPWHTAWYARQVPKTDIPLLETGQVVTVRLPMPTTRRGRYPIPEVWVTSVIPLGLCFAWKRFTAEGHYFVHPRPHGLPLDAAVTGPGELAGEEVGGGHEDVSGHRPYEPGDPLSRMDWRVFARTGKVMVRTLEGGRGGEIVLRWEDTRFLTDPEARLEQLSYWIDQCVREARPFRMILPGTPGDLGNRNLNACLEALAIFAAGPS